MRTDNADKHASTALGDSPAFSDSFDSLADVLEGADVGLAVFDPALALVACNEKYKTFFRYADKEAYPGVALDTLIRIKMMRRHGDPDYAERQVTEAKERLVPGSVQTFQFTTSAGQALIVTRRCLQDGVLVETVRPADPADASRLGAGALAELARQRLTHALEGMADGFCLHDAEGRLVLYNRKYVEYNSHVSDLILPGAVFEDLLRAGVDRGGFNIGSMDPDEFFELRLKQHKNPDAPYDMQLADGRWIRVHEKRTEDGGIVGIRSDITELKKRELDILRMTHELRKTNIQFDTALNNMIQGLCMFDDEQVLLVCNSRYLEMYGFDPQIVKPGIRLREIMEYSVSIGNYTEEDAKKAIAARPDQAKKRERTTLKQYLRDGRVIAVMHEPMPNGGSIATYQDITDLERREAQVQEYMHKLEISNRELQDFAHVASHDLKEPLRKIEAFGGRLATKFAGDLPDEGKLYVDRMQNAAGRMRQLIDDLLNFSRVTTKAQPFEETDLGEIAAEVVSDLQIRIEEANAEVVLGPLHKIDADPTQMRQLLQNLIGNALKFGKPDVKPIVRVETALPAERPGYCQIRVEDNGIGFDNKYKDQIFTIFQRLHGRHEYEGTGIGLATCRKIAEWHGGTIDAAGVLDEGAVFSVVLPVRHQEVD